MDPKDQKVRARIPLKNIGDQLLVIKSVKPSCGCTSAPLDKDSLLPGEETFLNITLSLPNMNGPLSTKHVTVETNEADSNRHDLALTLDVQRPLQISNSMIAFNAGKAGQIVAGEITFTSFASTPISITAIDLPSGFSVVNPLPAIIKPKETLTIKLNYMSSAAGPFRNDIVFHTDLEGYGEITLMAVGVIDKN
jgi:hypothetical protein